MNERSPDPIIVLCLLRAIGSAGTTEFPNWAPQHARLGEQLTSPCCSSAGKQPKKRGEFDNARMSTLAHQPLPLWFYGEQTQGTDDPVACRTAACSFDRDLPTRGRLLIVMSACTTARLGRLCELPDLAFAPYAFIDQGPDFSIMGVREAIAACSVCHTEPSSSAELVLRG